MVIGVLWMCIVFCLHLGIGSCGSMSLVGKRHLLLAPLEPSEAVLLEQIFTPRRQFWKPSSIWGDHSWCAWQRHGQNWCIYPETKPFILAKSTLQLADGRSWHHQQCHQKVSSTSLPAVPAQATNWVEPFHRCPGNTTKLLLSRAWWVSKLSCARRLVVTVCVGISSLLCLLDNVTEFIPRQPFNKKSTVISHWLWRKSTSGETSS